MQGLPSATLLKSSFLFDRSFVPSPQKCSEEHHRPLLHFSATAASPCSDTTQSMQSIYTNSKYEATLTSSLTVWGFPSFPLLWSHSNLVVERTFTRELRWPTRQSPPAVAPGHSDSITLPTITRDGPNTPGCVPPGVWTALTGTSSWNRCTQLAAMHVDGARLISQF